MLSTLALIPLFPMLGFLALALLGARLSRRTVAVIGVGSVGLSAIFSFLVTASFIRSLSSFRGFRLVLWQWIQVGSFRPEVTFYLDSLSATMMCTITLVGFLIHLYSAEFMRGDEGFSRFFAYMNLFVSAMLILVLADNLVFLLVGWEGVGLCSYLLIGFWYSNPANGRAAQKAFIVTRVGDTALIVGLLLLFSKLDTLQIQELLQRALQAWSPGSAYATAAALLLLGGAVGKSAQLPLQVWLPDAMAGPSPVSALIHAATMVTAGVYLIARMNIIFLLSPVSLTIVGIVGALTLLLAGSSALVTRDLKRVLAYSTISQIGYMFLGLGVGAFSAAIFHFVTHAFFKSLLFLTAGVIINSVDEHDIFKMRGLRDKLPRTFGAFSAGVLALSAVPFITSGFYSKDLILELAAGSGSAGQWLFAAGLLGSLITALYAGRLLFVVFFGPACNKAAERIGYSIQIPFALLAIGALAAGLLLVPGSLGPNQSILSFLQTVLPLSPANTSTAGLQSEKALLMSAPIVGLLLAAYLYLWRPTVPVMFADKFILTRWIRILWFHGWGFDWLYDHLFVKPFLTITRLNRSDAVDFGYTGVARLNILVNQVLVKTQSGIVQGYVVGAVIGVILLVAVMVWL